MQNTPETVKHFCMQPNNDITPWNVCKCEKNVRTMKPFTALLAIAERGIARAHLFMQLEWKGDHEINTLDKESKDLCVLVICASD